MNDTGNLVIILGLAALAGIIIGWSLRTFNSGGSARKVQNKAARDVQHAAQDAQRLRLSLGDKEQELRTVKDELQRAKLESIPTASAIVTNDAGSGTRAQVAEINELKRELASSRKALLDNQSEFNTYRTSTQKDHNQLQSELSKFKAGGSANTERLVEANETIAALRSATRENDKVIDSLRARVTEADASVENFRNQLKSSETDRNDVLAVTRDYDAKIEKLSIQLEKNNATVEKQKRDYDLMLENKNTDIKNLHSKIEETTKSSSSMQAREHDVKKQSVQHKETADKYQAEIVDLKKVLSDRDAALSKARNQISDLNTQIKLVKQHEEKEIQRLQAQVNDDTQESHSKIRSKSAEVSALNDMLKDSASKRDSLQADLESTKKTLSDKDKQINTLRAEHDEKTRKLRTELDDVIASRNKVSTQLGEMQSQGNIALEKLQQDFNNLAKTRDDYKGRIDNLQSEVSNVKDSKQQSESELKETARQLTNKNQTLKSETKVLQHEVRTLDTKRAEYKSTIEKLKTQITELTDSKEKQLLALKDQMTRQSKETENKLATQNKELAGKTNTLQNDLKTLQAKLTEQHSSLEKRQIELTNQTETNKRLATNLDQREKQVSDIRTKLVQVETESQRLNSELSDAEAMRLRLTERDAELRKAKIDLQEASKNAPLQSLVDEQTRKNDSLIAAMRERDDEIARLNTQMTNNTLRSKQQQSSITMLTQEKEAQDTTIKSLEQQAENTLHLHTKIAQQSTELEELRASLYERESGRTTTTRSSTSANTQSGVQSGLQQVETNTHTTNYKTEEKPRVFVRSDTEALTGTTGYQTQTIQRPQFTVDGHRVRRPDGSDDLTLLPGITQTVAGAFGRYGVADFEQIALWTDREVTHYADRVGVHVQQAQEYNWPAAARNILNGSYRKDSQEIGN